MPESILIFCKAKAMSALLKSAKLLMVAFSKAAKYLLKSDKCANLRLVSRSEYNNTATRYLSQITLLILYGNRRILLCFVFSVDLACRGRGNKKSNL